MKKIIIAAALVAIAAQVAHAKPYTTGNDSENDPFVEFRMNNAPSYAASYIYGMEIGLNWTSPTIRENDERPGQWFVDAQLYDPRYQYVHEVPWFWVRSDGYDGSIVRVYDPLYKTYSTDLLQYLDPLGSEQVMILVKGVPNNE